MPFEGFFWTTLNIFIQLRNDDIAVSIYNIFLSPKILPKEIHKIKEMQNNVYSTFTAMKKN